MMACISSASKHKKRNLRNEMRLINQAHGVSRSSDNVPGKILLFSVFTSVSSLVSDYEYRLSC